MAENDIRCEIYHVIHRYINSNNKYLKDYDKKESSYLKY